MTKDIEHELYKDFLKYAVRQGFDLEYVQAMYILHYESNGMHGEAGHAVYEFEDAMYDFLGVESVEEDSRLYILMEAPGIYEITHPYNFGIKE